MSEKKNTSAEQKSHHVVCFPIRHVDGFEHPRDAFDKRFNILQHIHNVLVREANARLTRLFSDKQYCALVQKYGRLKDKISEQERKALAKQLNIFVEKYELSGNYALHGYVTKVRNLYKENISSRQGQAEAERVMQGVAEVLYSTGKHLHFKKYSQVHSIQQNDTKNGVKFNIRSEHGTWNGLRFWCPINQDDPYIAEALLSEICYYRIKRKMFPSGYRYYLEIILKDRAPQKINSSELEGIGEGGIDMGPSTIAFASEKTLLLERLAPNVEKYNHQIKALQKQADKLNRALNPQYFNEDGTAVKKKKNEQREWKKSRQLAKLRCLISTLYRKKAEYIRQCHYTVANKIVKSCKHVHYEKVSVSGWAKRSTKPTEKSDKTVAVTNMKTGETKVIQKNKRKKRWGKSINDHAPSECEALIKQKCAQYGIAFDYTNTYGMRASQFNPVTAEFEKTELSKRMKTINGMEIQRDLLSSYITSHPNNTLDFPDTKVCYEKFDAFVEMHNELIAKMKASGISFKQCFGF